VPAHVDEREMWRKIRIRERSCPIDIPALRIFDTGPHAVPKEQVYGRLRVWIRGAPSDVKTSEGMLLGETVLECLDQSRGRD
jgi:hypothetical protein